MPGISWITITAGPDPAQNTRRVAPSWVKVRSVNPSSGSAILGPLCRTDVIETAIGGLGEARHHEACRDQRRDAAERDRGAETADARLDDRRHDEADGRADDAAHEQEPVRRAPYLGREQLGVERAQREAAGECGDDRDRRRDPEPHAAAEEEGHLE